MLDCSVGCVFFFVIKCNQCCVNTQYREPLGWMFPFKKVDEKMRQVYQHRPEIWPRCQNLLSTLKPKGYGILYNIFLITVFLTNVTQSQTNDENIIFSNLLFLIFCSKAATSKPLNMRSNSHLLTNFLLGFQGLQAMHDQNSLANSPHHNLKGHSTDFTSTITSLVILSTTQPVKTTLMMS